MALFAGAAGAVGAGQNGLCPAAYWDFGPPAGRLWFRRPVQARLTGRECCAAVARTRLISGSAGSSETLSLRKTRMPTVPLVEAQSTMFSATAGSLRSARLL